jgi:hypothetical protein
MPNQNYLQLQLHFQHFIGHVLNYLRVEASVLSCAVYTMSNMRIFHYLE